MTGQAIVALLELLRELIDELPISSNQRRQLQEKLYRLDQATHPAVRR